MKKIEKKSIKKTEKIDEKCEKKNKNEMEKYSVGRSRKENELRNMGVEENLSWRRSV